MNNIKTVSASICLLFSSLASAVAQADNYNEASAKGLNVIKYVPFASASAQERVAIDHIIANVRFSVGGSTPRPLYTDSEKASSCIARAQLRQRPARKKEILWKMPAKEMDGQTFGSQLYIYHWVGSKYRNISNDLEGSGAYEIERRFKNGYRWIVNQSDGDFEYFFDGKCYIQSSGDEDAKTKVDGCISVIDFDLRKNRDARKKSKQKKQ